jgi:hypothetical protein
MKNFTKTSPQGNNASKKINDYKKWLEHKNFAPETVEKYLRILNQYGRKKIDTKSITNFLRDNLTKCEPATLRGKRNVLASYAKFLKTYNEID